MLKKFKGLLTAPFKRRNAYQAKTVKVDNFAFEIRGLEMSDIKGLLDLEREVYQGELPWTKSAFVSELRSKIPNLYIGLFLEGYVKGFIGCRIIGVDAHITNVAVHSNFQGLGIGSLLLDEAEKFAIMNRCETMSLEVRMGNKDAQRLYRKVGFVSRTIKQQYYNETNEDALDMVKYL